jgi:hypothetical protein
VLRPAANPPPSLVPIRQRSIACGNELGSMDRSHALAANRPRSAFGICPSRPESLPPTAMGCHSRLQIRYDRFKPVELGMVQRQRRYGNTVNGPQRVGWVQPTGRNTISDGGLHPPYEGPVGRLHSNPVQACYPGLNHAHFFPCSAAVPGEMALWAPEKAPFCDILRDVFGDFPRVFSRACA